jgi:hypothetical protein
MTYTGSDATAGSEVHWYVGGTQASETKTVAAGDVSAGYIALAKKAEYGSVIVKNGSTVVYATEYSGATGTGAATDTSGTQSIKLASMQANDVLTITYLDISTKTLSEVAMCQNVKVSFKMDSISEDVHGQVNKVKKTGATDATATLEHLDYTSAFLETFFGDSVSDASGNMKYTTKYTGAQKGNLVGKRRTTAGVIDKKYFLNGAEPTNIGKDFPASGMYKDSLDLNIDDYEEWEAA